MNIKPSIYESLTPRQRVIATIEAKARSDDAEVKRLFATCPKKTYTQADATYTDMMQQVTAMSIAIEADIRGQVIGVLLSVMMDHDDALEKFLQNIANIRAAWNETIEALGIDLDTMKKFGPPSHIGTLLMDDMLPEPDSEAVGDIVEAMRNFIF